MFKRLRRVRFNEVVRNLVEENSLRVQDLIYPLFITHGENVKNAIASIAAELGGYKLVVKRAREKEEQEEEFKKDVEILKNNFGSDIIDIK